LSESLGGSPCVDALHATADLVRQARQRLACRADSIQPVESQGIPASARACPDADDEAFHESVNRSRKGSLLSLPRYFGKLYSSVQPLEEITMKKMIAAVLAGLFAAVTASSIVVAAEPKKDDMKKTEKKAEKK
jgi:hypothetical protein